MNKTTTTPQQEPIISLLSRISAFNKAHKTGVLVTLLVIIAAVCLGWAYKTHCDQIAEGSWAAYYTAQTAFATGADEQGLTQLDELNAKYPNTPAAEYAQLFKGDFLYAKEDFAKAADTYKNLLQARTQAVRNVAALSLAAAYQANGNYKESADVAADFIKNNPTSFALPQAYLTLALSQELAGNTEKAVEYYTYLLENYTKTYFGTFAKDKLAALKK